MDAAVIYMESMFVNNIILCDIKAYFQIDEGKWSVYALINYAIICTNDGFYQLDIWEEMSVKFQNKAVIIHQKSFGDIVCKVSAILLPASMS